MVDELVQRLAGTYDETLGGVWTAKYAEDPDTGLWTVEIFRHDVPEWKETGYATLEDCREGAREFYNQV